MTTRYALEQISSGTGTIADAAVMARSIEWPEDCVYVDCAVVERHRTIKRGRPAAKNVISGDIKKAETAVKSGDIEISHPSTDEIRKPGLSL
jgi:hypothetical protein